MAQDTQLGDFALLDQSYFFLVDVEVVLLQMWTGFLDASVKGIISVVVLLSVAGERGKAVEGVVAVLCAVCRGLLSNEIAAFVIGVGGISGLSELVEGIDRVFLGILSTAVVEGVVDILLGNKACGCFGAQLVEWVIGITRAGCAEIILTSLFEQVSYGVILRNGFREVGGINFLRSMEEVPGVGDFSDGSMFFKKPSCEVVGGVFVFAVGTTNGFEVAGIVEILNAGLIGQGNP